MKVVPFHHNIFDEMVDLFVEEHSEEPDRQWDAPTAKRYLKLNTENYADFCLIAVDDLGECIGGVFSRPVPYYKGIMLFVDSLQVKRDYRRQGVASMLLKELLEKAKHHNIKHVHILSDARRGFPREWLERIGFEISGWSEFEADTHKVKL